MEELFGPHLVSKNGQIPSSSLNAFKYVLVYFSAHWCPPCRGFTPKLGLFYDNVNAGEKTLEIVYVSGDRTPEQFEEYYDEQPWVAVPFTENEKRAQLNQHFKVAGIPALFLIDQSGKVLKDTCRMDVTSKGPLCLAEWDQLLNN